MSDAGYVKIHRRLLGHHAFRNDSEALAFAWMVTKASWKDTRVRYKEHNIVLRRGDLAVSIRDLATTLDRPKGWIERLLIRLKNETMIETRRAEGGRTAPLVITIRNYDVFQASQDSDRTPSETPDRTRGGTQTGQRPDREQGIEEYKNKEERVLRARKLPEGFEPKDGSGKMAEVAARWTPDRRAKELERWRAHHIAKGTTMKDWDAAWQTWIGNSEKFAGFNGRGAEMPRIPI